MTNEPTKNPIFTRQEQLAPTGQHDTHFYDPNATDDQIVVVFETFDRARAARDVLAEANVPRSAIDIVHGEAEEGDAGFTYERTDRGFWSAITSLFSAGEEPQNSHAEAVSRGHAVMRVQPPSGQRAEIVRLLGSLEPIDFDARLEEWRSAGWNGIYAQREAYDPAVTASPGVAPASQAAASAASSPTGRAADIVSTGEPKGTSGSSVESTGVAGAPAGTTQPRD